MQRSCTQPVCYSWRAQADTAGDTLLTLTRTHNGEEIAVDLHVNNQPEPEYEGGEDGEATEPITSVVFNVSVVKGEGRLIEGG